MTQVRSPSFRVPLTALVVAILAIVAGCPQPLPAEPDAQWRKVESSGPTETPEQKAIRERAQRNAAEATVRKMRAALVSAEEKACTTDAECSLTPQHCCTCAAGGRLEAVNAEKLPDLIKRRSIVCADYVCPQVVSTDPSCNATTAACREGKCVPVIPEGAGEAQGIGVEPIEGANTP